MFKKIIVIPIFLSILMFFASLSGVFAAWFFAEESPESVNQSKGITISEFVWKPEEILPDITPGQNYLDLHKSILENVKGGLNSSKDTLEKAVLKDDDGLLHSSQNVQGGNLTHLFITQATHELDFIVKYVSDNEFWVFMYEDAKATNGSAGTTKISVYKTFYIKTNNTWEGKEAQFGLATVQFFPNTNILAIDVDSWYKP